MKRQLPILGLALVAAATAAGATDIYTWVDDAGVVNYSTSVPQQGPAKVFKGEATPRRTPSGGAPAERTLPEQRLLVERIGKLEADLDKEREARFGLLQSQIEREREEVKQLRQERVRLLDNFGPIRPDLVAPAVVAPAAVYYLPEARKHKPKKDADRPVVEDRRGYPPLSASPSVSR